MKGIETIPIKLILVAFLLLIVVWVGLAEVNIFLSFNTEKDFKQDISDIVYSMKMVKASGDYGAFTTANIKVPDTFSIVFDVDNDTLTGYLWEGGNYTINLTENNINVSAVKLMENVTYNGTVSFPSGKLYSLMLYYGELQEEQIKDYTLLFK